MNELIRLAAKVALKGTVVLGSAYIGALAADKSGNLIQSGIDKIQTLVEKSE